MGNSPVERVETKNGGHWYRDKRTGKKVPGVTTILKALPKEKLESWKLRKAVSLALGGESAWKNKPDGADLVPWLIDAGDREANKAATVGTNAHQFAEDYMLGKNPDIGELSKPEKKHAECFLNFVRDYQPDPVLIEKVIVYVDDSGTPLYSGTLDLIAKLYWNDESDPERLPNDWEDGLVFSLDWKASSSSPRASHALQLAAYRYATHWIDENDDLQPMPHVDKSAVVLLNGGKPGRCYRAVSLDTSPVVFSVFKSLLRISNFSAIEDRLIGSEL